MPKRSQTKTQKLRQTVSRRIRELEKRGYRFDTGLKEDIQNANYSRLKSLQNKNYSKLYAKATAELDGEIVSGTEKRSFERKVSAQKSAESRRLKKGGGNWQEKRRIQDMIDRQNAMYFREGEIAYNEIENLIGDYPTKGSRILEKALRSEISRYGRDNVVKAMGKVPDDIISKAQNIIYYEDDADAISSAIVDFFSIINDTIASTEEAQMLGDVQDDMTDMGD